VVLPSCRFRPYTGTAAWARMTREAGMRLAAAASARRYLYELLTGCGTSLSRYHSTCKIPRER
jgi:hypothetical protein